MTTFTEEQIRAKIDRQVGAYLFSSIGAAAFAAFVLVAAVLVSDRYLSALLIGSGIVMLSASLLLFCLKMWAQADLDSFDRG